MLSLIHIYSKFPSARNQLVKMALFREGENYCRMGEFGKGAELLERFLKEYRNDPVARNVNAGEVQGLSLIHISSGREM